METVASHSQYLSKVSLGQPLSSTALQKRSALGRKRVPLRRRVIWHHAVRIYSQAGFGRGTVKIKEEEEESDTTETEPSSGTKKLFNLPIRSKLPGTVKVQNKSQSQAKSNKVVFVAGATGKVGSRTVRELLKLGFSVRASTRNAEKAQALFEDVASSSAGAVGSDDASPFGIFSLFGFLKPKAGKRLEIVECDLEDPESIEPALGNAGVVLCCIGASEKEVLDVSGPYRIDFKATENLINAASSAEVNHFVLLTSLGTQKFGFPAAVLNLFWGVLLWKAKAEKALIQSGLPYTIVRPGGMERPTDAYKETHNLLLAEADKLFGGQVSNLQVAELLASIVENPDVSVNKIVEAIAETTAPLRPIKELLEEIPSKEISSSGAQGLKKAKPVKADAEAQKPSKKQEEEKTSRALAAKERQEKRIQAEKLAEDKRAQAQREKEEKRIQAERDEKEKQRLQALRKKYEEEIEAAREKEEAAKSAAAAALEEKAELEKKAEEIRAKAEAAALAASQAKAVEAAVLAAARKGNVLSYEEKQKIMESVRLARLPKESVPAEQPKKKKQAFSFGGRAAPSSVNTETTTETEPSKVAEEDKDAESKVKAKKQVKGKLMKDQEAKKKEEQEKLAEEAKERVEAKQREEAKARKKEEELAEAKKKEAEEKAKIEAEAKQKEEELAEAKKKEEEEKAKKEAEALTAQEEEKAKALAEEEAPKQAAMLKAHEEEKAQSLAEEEAAAMLKAQEEEKAKAMAEEEAAAMLKAQEEEKVKALAEEEAAKQAAMLKAQEEEKEKAKALAEEEAAKKQVVESKEAASPAPRSKGFRWFWQPADPETPDVEGTIKEEVAEVPVEAKLSDQLPPCPTPLSPYTRYPGLKPPAPPIASAPAPKPAEAAPPKADPVRSEVKAVAQATAKVEPPPQEEPAVIPEAPSEDIQDDIEPRTQKIQETAEREREALEKAQTTFVFKWPWQKLEETTVDEPAAAVKEEKPAASQEPVSSVEAQEAVPIAITSQEKTDTLPQSSRPLSPYAQFPNLKPPNPPKPSSATNLKPVEMLPSSATNSKPVEMPASSSVPLSPYAGFPDLKPPTSPAPTTCPAPAPAPEGNGAVQSVDSNEEEKLPEPAADSGFKWPWQQ
ncbi:hypothetical protein GOP47_0018638 [Adiantum capillus-veneris]|uniref:NAD(P)-binding domain-containing protein n=1 Tax=Adiantum capillus-veneris TaxID=13818 RepID=A0A9D4UEV6_ADICA|nr:hypothetical protein GOP47_0018638 [Adiantum capillus-veneris]